MKIPTISLDHVQKACVCFMEIPIISFRKTLLLLKITIISLDHPESKSLKVEKSTKSKNRQIKESKIPEVEKS